MSNIEYGTINLLEEGLFGSQLAFLQVMLDDSHLEILAVPKDQKLVDAIKATLPLFRFVQDQNSNCIHIVFDGVGWESVYTDQSPWVWISALRDHILWLVSTRSGTVVSYQCTHCHKVFESTFENLWKKCPQCGSEDKPVPFGTGKDLRAVPVTMPKFAPTASPLPDLSASDTNRKQFPARLLSPFECDGCSAPVEPADGWVLGWSEDYWRWETVYEDTTSNYKISLHFCARCQTRLVNRCAHAPTKRSGMARCDGCLAPFNDEHYKATYFRSPSSLGDHRGDIWVEVCGRCAPTFRSQGWTEFAAVPSKVTLRSDYIRFSFDGIDYITGATSFLLGKVALRDGPVLRISSWDASEWPYKPKLSSEVLRTSHSPGTEVPVGILARHEEAIVAIPEDEPVYIWIVRRIST